MTLRLALLSDLHFGEAAPEAVARLAADVTAACPDALLISGDLTRQAEPSEFAAGRAFLAGFSVPVLLVPGNHDIPRLDLWERFAAPRARWFAAGLGDTAPRLELAGATILGLDSVRPAQWHLDWSAGAVSARRRLALAAQLRTTDQPVLLVCHHPLRHPPGLQGRRRPAGADSLLALLTAAGVVAVLSGHLHRAAVLGQGPAQVIAPSALSPRLKAAGNGWLLLTLTGRDLAIELREPDGHGAWTGRALV